MRLNKTKQIKNIIILSVIILSCFFSFPKNILGKTVYSIQIGAYKNIEHAKAKLQTLPQHLKQNAFISKKKNKFWSVNIFQYKTKKKALKQINNLRKTFAKCYIIKIQKNTKDISIKNRNTKNINKQKNKKTNFADFSFTPKSSNIFDIKSIQYRSTSDTFEIRGYIDRVEKTNINLKIAFKDYKKSILNFAQILNDYNWKVDFEASAGKSYDGENHFDTKAGISINKIIYNGGAYPVLEKEQEIVAYLEKQNLIKQNDLLVLSAIATYSAKLYSQQIKSFVEKQFKDRKKLFETVKKLYQKGTSVSKYDFLTEKRELSKLEMDFLESNSLDNKAEIEFRYLGRIYAKKPIILEKFNVDYNFYFPELQKKALVNNSTIKADRYAFKNSLLSFEAAKKSNKPLINFTSEAGFEHSTNNTGQTKNFYYNIGINLTYPIFDGNIRKTNLVISKLDALKSKLKIQKDSEDVVKKLNLLYENYKLYKEEEKKLNEIFKDDKERLYIAKRKYLQGIGDYTSIRDSWNDLLDTKKKLLNVYIMKNKIMLDMLIFAGEKL